MKLLFNKIFQIVEVMYEITNQHLQLHRVIAYANNCENDKLIKLIICMGQFKESWKTLTKKHVYKRIEQRLYLFFILFWILAHKKIKKKNWSRQNTIFENGVIGCTLLVHRMSEDLQQDLHTFNRKVIETEKAGSNT